MNHDVVIYNFRRELVERLLSSGNEVIISSPYGERIDKLIELGCTYDQLDVERHGTNPFEDGKLYNHYKKIMREYNPDVILTYTIKPNIYGAMAAKKLNIPCIANITGLGTALEKPGILQKLLILLYKIAFSDIQKVFFQNKENMLFFENYKIAIKQHELLPGSGVNLNQFCVLNYPLDNQVKFCFISRIMKTKGIDQFLDAAKYIKNKYPNTQFHICGFCEEAYEEKLKQLEDQNIIKYHGMVDDVRIILEKTHCTIHPTYYPEGISNVLLESAACGRPIITTNRSGTKEVVEDGITGYLIQEKNSNDLIDKIETFLKLNYDNKKIMGLKAREKVEKEFDREIVVDKYVNEIQNLKES